MNRKRRREFVPLFEPLERRELLAVAVGKPPVLKAPALTQTYVENLPPAFVLSSSATLTDTDSPNLSRGSLTVGVVGNANANDRLSIISQAAAAKGVLVANSIVSFAGARVGTVSGGVGSTPLVIKFDSPAATPAAAQAILRQVAFQTLGDTPSTLPRTIQLTATDGEGNASLPLKRSVLVTAVNDAPILRKIGNQILATTEGNVDGSDFYLASSQVLGSPLTLAIRLSATDPEASPVQYSFRVVRAPAVAPATVALNAGTLSIVGKPNATGSMVIEVAASDGSLTDSCQFRVDCNETTINNIKISGPVLRAWLEGGGVDGYGNPTGMMTKGEDGTLNQQFQFGGIHVTLDGAPTLEPTYSRGEFAQPGSPTYSRRPTLVVLVQGANTNGYCLYPWQIALRKNLITDLEKQGSQTHVMEVMWDTYAVNTKSVSILADKIKRWLNERQQKWDIVLVGHSRGGVFTSELASKLAILKDLDTLPLRPFSKVGQFYNIMIDPTAAVVQGDQYPKSTASGVDRAVTYDDGYPFGFGPTFVKDGLPIPGAEYRRVSVPGMGFMDTWGSHGKLADYYASTLYKNDLAKLLQGNPADPKKPFKAEVVDVYGVDEEGVEGWMKFELVVLPKQTKNEGAVIKVTADFSHGTARGTITVLGVGSADVSIGKSGVSASIGVACLPKLGVAITESGATIQVADPTGLLSGGVIVSKDETRLDVNFAGVQVSIGGPGAGVYMGGHKISINRDIKLPAGTFKWEQTKPDGATVTEIYKDAKKIALEKKDVFGNYVSQRWNALGSVFERGNINGPTWSEERDKLGKALSQSYLLGGQWNKDTLDGLGKVINTDLFSGKFGSPLQKTTRYVAGIVAGIKDFNINGGLIGEQFSDAGKWVTRGLDGLGHKLTETIKFGDIDSFVFQKFSWNPSGDLISSFQNQMDGNEVRRIAQQFLSNGKWIEQKLNLGGKVLEQITHFGGINTPVFEVSNWNEAGVNTAISQWKENGQKKLLAERDKVGNWVETHWNASGNPFKYVFDSGGNFIPSLSEWDGGAHAGQVFTTIWKGLFG